MSTVTIDQMLKIIPIFNGDKADLHRFLAWCDVVYKPLKDTEHVIFLNIVKTKLNGRAYDMLKFEAWDDWATIKKEIQTNFGEQRSVEHLQMELMHIRQNRDEPISSYANRIETILMELNGACLIADANAGKSMVKFNKTTALRSFQEGLSDPIKLVVKACRFKELKDAIAKAQEEEALNKYYAKSNISKTFPIQCQLCKKNGHVASKCYSLRNLNQRHTQTNSNSFSNQNNCLPQKPNFNFPSSSNANHSRNTNSTNNNRTYYSNSNKYHEK